MQTFNCRKRSGLFRNFSTLFSLTTAFLLMGFSLAGCGKSEEGSQTKLAASPASSEVQFDACALLAEADPANLLGEEVGEPDRKTHDLLQKVKAKSVTISHCGFTGKKSGLFKFVSLMVKHVGKVENPKTAKAFLETQQKQFEGIEMKAEKVPGLGDVAVKMTMPKSFQLWVFWNKHYQMNIILNGLKDDEVALERTRAVAQHVMSKL